MKKGAKTPKAPLEHPTLKVYEGGVARPARLIGFTDQGYPMYEGGDAEWTKYPPATYGMGQAISPR
ncbi:hypothetical protein ACFLXO_04130 [Chloroflexota bacterium]